LGRVNFGPTRKGGYTDVPFPDAKKTKKSNLQQRMREEEKGGKRLVLLGEARSRGSKGIG